MRYARKEYECPQSYNDKEGWHYTKSFKEAEEEMMDYIKSNKVPCPTCGKCDFTDLRDFNLMFKTNRGVVVDNQSLIYLRHLRITIRY